MSLHLNNPKTYIELSPDELDMLICTIIKASEFKLSESQEIFNKKTLDRLCAIRDGWSNHRRERYLEIDNEYDSHLAKIKIKDDNDSLVGEIHKEHIHSIVYPNCTKDIWYSDWYKKRYLK